METLIENTLCDIIIYYKSGRVHKHKKVKLIRRLNDGILDIFTNNDSSFSVSHKAIKKITVFYYGIQ